MDRMLSWLLVGFNRMLSMIPLRMMYLLSDMAYVTIYHLVGYRKKVVRKNLDRAFPDKTPAERRRIERRFYHFLCDYFFETVKILSYNKRDFARHMSFEGLDLLHEALDKHGMVFVALGHYCNWEYIASLQWFVRGDVLCSQLYSPLRSKAYDHLFLTIRSHFGGLNIKKYDALRTILRLHRDGQKTVVGFIADQSPKWQNTHMFMPFLNQDTPVFTGMERIARKVDAAVFTLHASRPGRGRYVCRFVPLSDDVGSLQEYESLQLFMHDLEQQIKAEPHLWLWTHDRWKRQRTDADAPQEWKDTLRDGKPVTDRI